MLRERVQRVLAGLVAAAALPGAPPATRAARIIDATVQGITMDWALRPRGRLADRLRGDLRTVLTAWR
jgi:hypothetical protein